MEGREKPLYLGVVDTFVPLLIPESPGLLWMASGLGNTAHLETWPVTVKTYNGLECRSPEGRI